MKNVTIASILRIIFQMKYQKQIATTLPIRAFTLVELLVVIAIISILVALVTVAGGKMLQRSKSTKDMSNHRTIGMATFSHSTDNNGRLLHPRTGPILDGGSEDPSTESQIKRFWIAAHGQDANGDNRLVQTGGDYVELKSALEDGAAYQYIGDVMAYQSPLDPTIGDVTGFVFSNPNFPKGRIRSYSLNAFVGVEWGADDGSDYADDSDLNLADQGYWVPTETISQIPQPANTMCSIGEEDKYGRNGHGWLISPTTTFWNDFPAFWDDRRINLSYVDGSTGSIALESDALKEIWLNDDDGHDVDIPDNEVEYDKFRRVLLPGVIGSVLD